MLRILHLPNVIGGHPVALAQAESSLGSLSHSLSITNSPYNYQPDIQLSIDQLSRFSGWRKRVRNFIKLRNKYDVFHFNAGSSLLNSRRKGFELLDLKFYPKNSIKIMTFQGTDARLEYNDILDKSMTVESETTFKYAAKQTLLGINKHQDNRLRIMESTNRYCDHIFFLNPDLGNGLRESETSFLPYAIANPCSGSDVFISKRNKKTPVDEPIKIVHLSTNRLLKGTGLIENSITEAAKNIPISYETIYKQPRDVALEKLANADLVIDQMVLGWYGAAAVEAMYMGKPVIGYIDRKNTGCVPKSLIQDLPISQASLTTLTQRIVELASDRALRLLLAEKGKEFSEKWHSPINVAKSTLAHYERFIL